MQAGEPFHPTVLVDIRKRMVANSFDSWNGTIIERADGIRPKKKRKVKGEELHDGRDVPPANKGTLKIDATVADQKITYPTDADLL